MKIKKIELKAHLYADKTFYRPEFSEWLKSFVDYKEGYTQAAKDFKISLTDELGNCHAITMNRIETLEWKLKDANKRINNLQNTIKELRKN